MMQQGSKAIRHIAVEGNIGSGKSTLLRILRNRSFDRLTVDVVPEPLNKWQRIGNDTVPEHKKENLLEKFYKDPHRWAYTFQAYACLSRVQAQLDAPRSHLEGRPNPTLIFERSIYSDRLCFGLNSYEIGFLTDMEWFLYCDWNEFIVKKLSHIDGVIYLQTDPKVCFERLQKRSRKEEGTVDLDYLERLHQKHENWLVHQDESISAMFKGYPILVLNGNEDFEASDEKQDHLSEEVSKFLTRVHSDC
eukprot:m.310112 g.310112  ORF g.310112 m.310112 type:complete len:248 (+) comp49620_c0_seq1:44-787(+)